MRSQASIRTKLDKHNQFRNYVPKESDRYLSFDSDKIQKNMGVQESKWSKIQETVADNGYHHVKLLQSYKSIEVLGGIYNLHKQNGQLISSNGHFLPDVDLHISPKFQKNQVEQIAIMDMRTNSDPQNISKSPYRSSIISVLSNDVKITDVDYPKFSGKYILAYDVAIQSDEPYDKQRYIIDAMNGRIVKKVPLIMNHAVPGIGVCKYYGEQMITIDSISPSNYELFDADRNVLTVGPNSEVFSNESAYWDLTNDDQDEVALDAHYCSEQFYDFMLSTFDWKGIDNEGGPLISVVHIGDIVNASWNGYSAAFGDGNCHNGPLTTLEVVGHEFMHGVTDYTSELIYADESGAINESMSDIFGKGLEYYADSLQWSVGASFHETEYAMDFRSFVDPNLFFHPKFYNGLYWFNSGNVHTNSSIGNHWFYLLVNGGQGVNEIGENYDITGIGMDKALQIVFSTQRNYLFPSATYADYYETSILACRELFNVRGGECNSLIDAWKAVGLPSANLEVIYDLEISFKNESFEFLCMHDDYYTLELTISNVGEIDYYSNDPLAIYLNGDKVYSLESDLKQGESVSFSHEYNLGDESGSDFLYAYFSVSDLISSNNSDYLFIFNSKFQMNDIDLDYAMLQKKKYCSDSFFLELYLKNASCDILYSGTSLDVKIINNNEEVVWTETISLPYSISIGGYYLSREISFPITDQTLDHSIEVYIEGDPYLLNNKISIPYRNLYTNYIFGPMNESFDGEFVGIPEYGNFQLGPYLENLGLITTGRYTSGSFSTLCPAVDDNIINNGGNPSLSYCVDLSSHGATSLNFDLIQFHNDVYEFQELAPIGSILKVLIQDEDESLIEDYIFDQIQGEKINHEYHLTENFVGTISFDFFNNTGSTIGSLDYLDYDVMIFDNLTIEETIVSSDDEEYVSQKKYPNPSDGLVFFESSQDVADIYVQSVDGKLVKSVKKHQLNNALDIYDLPSGIYITSIHYESGEKQIGKIIKISN